MDSDNLRAIIELLDKVEAIELTSPTVQIDRGPTHVKQVQDMTVGKRYRKHYRGGGHSDFVFLGLEMHKITPISKPALMVKMYVPRYNRTRYEFREDCGLKAYDKYNTWNETNWIERLEP